VDVKVGEMCMCGRGGLGEWTECWTGLNTLRVYQGDCVSRGKGFTLFCADLCGE
jgi:hypothetical protein